MTPCCPSPCTVASLPLWAHALGLVVVIAIGVTAWLAIGLLLDGPATRHALHWWSMPEGCGRCVTEERARRSDREFAAAPGDRAGIARAVRGDR